MLGGRNRCDDKCNDNEMEVIIGIIVNTVVGVSGTIRVVKVLLRKLLL